MTSNAAVTRRWAWAVASGLAVMVASGCGDDAAGIAAGERMAAPGSNAERSELREYERAADDLVDRVHALVQGVVDLQAALDDEDDAATDAQLDALPATLDDVEDAADRLQSAEEALGGNQYGDEPAVARQGLAFLPVLATLAGLASFARFLKGKSDEMNAQRDRRDDACAGVADNEPGAIEACQAARDDMARTGAEVIERTTQEVVTELVLSPLNPQSLGGLALKEAAGEALQAGMTVLSSHRAVRGHATGRGLPGGHRAHRCEW